jgi:hypothetical protein
LGQLHAVVRRYREAAALSEAMADRLEEVEGLLRGVAGFVAYYAVRAGDDLTTISVYDNRAGVEEANRRTAGWIKENVDPALGPPDLTEGEVFIDLER